MSRICMALLLALAVACSTPPANNERAAETNTTRALPTNTAQVIPTPVGQLPGLICRTVISEVTGGPLVTCAPQDDAPEPPKRQPCEDINGAIIGKAFNIGKCVPTCNNCDFTPAQLAEADKDLDSNCDKLCRSLGSCPEGQTCVMKEVLNRTTVKSCIAKARFCQPDPKNPDLCVRLQRISECTCKCVREA